MQVGAAEAKAAKSTKAAAKVATASKSKPADATAAGGDKMVVTAFKVLVSIDYGKLIEKFGSKPLTSYLLRRLENVTVKRGLVPRLHIFLRREIFFSHRDIKKICKLLEG